jgi:hypothetical protein
LVAAGYSATLDTDTNTITISGFQVDTLVNNSGADSSIATQFYFEEDADGAFSLDSGVTLTNLTVTVQVDTTDDELELRAAEGANFTAVTNADTDISYGVSELGTYYEADVDEYTSINVWTPMDEQTKYEIYFAESDAVVTSEVTDGTGSLGKITVTDKEVSSVNTKNLIIVGGSCINSAAANVLGVSENTCGSDWTSATSVGSGQFLIQSFSASEQSLTSKIALLVAGYDAADTVNAATYLTTKPVDTTAGKKYIGTSSTSAVLQTTTE